MSKGEKEGQKEQSAMVRWRRGSYKLRKKEEKSRWKIFGIKGRKLGGELERRRE